MNDDKQQVFDKIVTQVKGVYDKWYQGDPMPSLEFMEDRMSYFSPFFNSRIEGKKALEALLTPIIGQVHSPGYEMVNQELILGESLAVLLYNLHELGEDGSLTAGWKVTDVFQKVGDDWRNIHWHFSAYTEEG